MVSHTLVSSYLAFPPLPASRRYLSVALSLGSPPAAVSRYSCPVELGLSSDTRFRLVPATVQSARSVYFTGFYGYCQVAVGKPRLASRWPRVGFVIRIPRHTVSQEFCHFCQADLPIIFRIALRSGKKQFYIIRKREGYLSRNVTEA